jgi:23S rRNA (cytosine1962-C5)-methyltransferase
VNKSSQDTRPAEPPLPRTITEIARRIEAAAAQRAKALPELGETNLVRLVHGAADGLPGVLLDRYDTFGVLHLVNDEAIARGPALVEQIALLAPALGLEGLYRKSHPRTARELTDEGREESAPRTPSWGVAAPDELRVKERGMTLIAKLGDGLATGVYPDQRNSRTRLAGLVSGKSLLNLFGYTGAFSVSAALAGARRTVTVDLSKTSLAWAEENFRANDPDWEAHRHGHSFLAEDAVGYLAKAKAKSSRFDVIVLDPPSFATHKSGRFSVEDDYTAVVAACLRVLAPEGTLLAVTNHRKLTTTVQRAMVQSAARTAGREVRRLDQPPPPADFPVDPTTKEPATKALFLHVV